MACKIAVSDDPENPDLRRLYGIVLFEVGEHCAAVDQFAEVQIWPDPDVEARLVELRPCKDGSRCSFEMPCRNIVIPIDSVQGTPAERESDGGPAAEFTQIDLEMSFPTSDTVMDALSNECRDGQPITEKAF